MITNQLQFPFLWPKSRMEKQHNLKHQIILPQQLERYEGAPVSRQDALKIIVNVSSRD